MFRLLRIPDNFWFDVSHCEIYWLILFYFSKECGVLFYLTVKLPGIRWIFSRLVFKLFKDESKMSLTALKGSTLLRLLLSALSIVRTFHCGWWKHQLSPVIWEFQELSAYRSLVFFSSVSYSFLSPIVSKDPGNLSVDLRNFPALQLSPIRYAVLQF